MDQVRDLQETFPSSRPSWRYWRNMVIKAIGFVLLLLFLYVHFADPIRLVTADLGRHLKNGELILAGQSKILTSNFYSYTDPDHPFTNHHWGTGVLFYLVYKMSGFSGLSFFYIGILLIGFCIYFYLACRLSSFSWAFFFAVLALPIFTDRLEIRPEGITTLLTGLYLYVLFMFRHGKLSFKKLLWIVPFLQIVWVNTHILFFIGGVLVFIFVLDAWLGKQDKTLTRQMWILMTLMSAACLVNPAGLKGALVPLTIFQEYGYRLAENQTVFFMQKRFGHDLKYLYFEFLVVLSLAALVRHCIVRRWRNCLAEILVVLFFLALGLKTVRSMASYAFVFVPMMSFFVWSILDRYEKVRKILGILFGLIGTVFVVMGTFLPNNVYSPLSRLETFVRLNNGQPPDVNFGYMLTHPQIMTGLVPGISGAADFVTNNNLQGPIFNNYDIG
ncbi:MAG: hypothetical protein JNN05_06335, partial [Candidatus Omnitrophica bacterium]|nr:hypothetical protein [Candidatus Omnitrophota bacterium]